MNKLYQIIIVILILISSYFIFSLHKENQTLKNAKSLIEDTLFIERKFKDKQGNQHTEVITKPVDEKNSDIVFKKIAKDLNVKPKDIKNQTDVATTIDTTFRTKTDTLYLPSGKKEVRKSYVDRWNDIAFYNDSLHISIWDELTITSLKKRTKFWHLSKSDVLDVENSNPLIAISNVKNYAAIKPTPIFIIAPSIGIGYSSDLKLKPYLGISISYFPISIKIY